MSWGIFISAFSGGIAAFSISMMWRALKHVKFVCNRSEKRFKAFGVWSEGSEEGCGVWLYLGRLTIGVHAKIKSNWKLGMRLERMVFDEYSTTLFQVACFAFVKWVVLSDNGSKKMFCR